MKSKLKNRFQQAAMFTVCTWGLLSVLFLSGEPASDKMSALQFTLLKLAGLASLAGSILVGRWAIKKGWLKFNPEDNIA